MLKIGFYHCICPSRGLIPNDNLGSGSYLLAGSGAGSWKVKVSDPYGSGSATLLFGHFLDCPGYGSRDRSGSETMGMALKAWI